LNIIKYILRTDEFEVVILSLILPLVIFIYILIYIAKLCIAHTCVRVYRQRCECGSTANALHIDSKHLEEQGTACVTANPGEDASAIEISIEYYL
jgi:hypothetical protein